MSRLLVALLLLIGASSHALSEQTNPIIDATIKAANDISSPVEPLTIVSDAIEAGKFRGNDLVTAYFLRAALLGVSRPEAFRDAAKIIELRPRDPWAYFARGTMYQALLNVAKARADFIKAIELSPRMASAYYFLYMQPAPIHVQISYLISAAKAAARGEEQRSDWYRVCEKLGSRGSSACDRPDTRPEKLKSEVADELSNYLKMVDFYLKMSRWQEAIRTLAELSELPAEDFDIQRIMPLVVRGRLVAHEPRLALPVVDRCIKRLPRDVTCRILRGEAYAALGQRDEAAKDFRAALTLAGGDDAQRRAILDHLALLGVKP